MEDKNKFIDELLDSALAHRRKAVPSPGLEARILESVRAASSQRPSGGELWIFSRKGWITVAVAAAVFAIIAVAQIANRQHSPSARTSQAGNAVSAQATNKGIATNPEASPSASTMATIVSPKHTPRLKRVQPRRTETRHWPSQFPFPAPLSPEERALVQYVRETPPEVLAALFKEQSTAQHVELKSLKIPPLEIQPLAVGATRRESQ